MNTVSPSIIIQEDSAKLVGKISVSKAIQHIEQDERFGEIFGDVRIGADGHMIVHGGSKRSDAFVRGICEYSLGKHKIRFIITRESIDWFVSFGIISKAKPIPQKKTGMRRSVYGWTSADDTLSATTRKSATEFQDMKAQKKIEIELSLDCDNRKISYLNQQTKNIREINVDINICPLPWQFLFYLFDLGVSVQLISAS